MQAETDANAAGLPLSKEKPHFDCAVSIYSSRETPEMLAQTVRCACASAKGRRSAIDVVINGNPDLARALAADAQWQAAGSPDLRLRIWAITMGDKAFAWNQYLHELAPAARSYVFIDGYVRVDVPAIGRLCDALWHSEAALAATGLPRVGHSAAAVAAMLRRDGGVHGNLYALKSVTVAELRRIGFRLPLAIYRTDPTLAAAINFGLNLFPREWKPKDRIVADAGVGWDLTPLSWWRPADVKTHFKRVLRQAQGTLENAAVRNRFAERGLPFESLPRTATELVAEWMSAAPEEAARLLRRDPLARRAWRLLQQPRDWSRCAVAPQLLLDHPSTSAKGPGPGGT